MNTLGLGGFYLLLLLFFDQNVLKIFSYVSLCCVLTTIVHIQFNETSYKFNHWSLYLDGIFHELLECVLFGVILIIISDMASESHHDGRVSGYEFILSTISVWWLSGGIILWVVFDFSLCISGLHSTSLCPLLDKMILSVLQVFVYE